MPSRFFAQSVAVLFEEAPVIEEVVAALDGFEVERIRPPRPDRSWVGGHSEAIVAYRPELGGRVIADSVGAPWPDGMGDGGADLPLFGAWTLGAFGPQVFPGALERAGLHARASAEDYSGEEATAHQGLLRLRLSYILGADEGAELWPDASDPTDEIRFLASLSLAAMSLPGALAYFNPNGEVLAPLPRLRAALELPDPPVALVAAVRHDEIHHAPGWGVSDTMGMGQLRLPDLEVTYPTNRADVQSVAAWLRDRQLELLGERGDVEQLWPAGSQASEWQSLGLSDESLIAPSRPTVRFRAAPADSTS